VGTAPQLCQLGLQQQQPHQLKQQQVGCGVLQFELETDLTRWWSAVGSSKPGRGRPNSHDCSSDAGGWGVFGPSMSLVRPLVDAWTCRLLVLQLLAGIARLTVVAAGARLAQCSMVAPVG